MGVSVQTLSRWRWQLAIALERFWSGQYAEADVIFGKALLALLPLLYQDASQLKSKWPGANERPAAARSAHHLYALAALGKWAVQYVSEQKRQAHPPISDHLPEQEKLWHFVIDVHCFLSDTSGPALTAYTGYLSFCSRGDRALRIARLLANIPNSDQALPVLQHLFRLYPKDKQIGQRLCLWLLEREDWTAAQEIAAELYQQDRDDLFAVDCMAYLAEQRKAWHEARTHYTTLRNWERLVLLAVVMGDVGEAERLLQKAPANTETAPVWALCQGWVAYQQGRFDEALDQWSAVVRRSASQAKLSPPKYSDLQTDPLQVCQKLLNAYGSSLPQAARSALTWLVYRLAGRTQASENLAESIEQLERFVHDIEPSTSKMEDNVFLSCVAGSFGLACLQEGRQNIDVYTKAMPAYLTAQAKIIGHAQKAQWLAAVNAFDSTTPFLLWYRIVQRALRSGLQRRDWRQVGIALHRWRPAARYEERDKIEALQNYILQRLWQQQDPATLADELSRRIVSVPESVQAVPDTVLLFDGATYERLQHHHNAALVYIHKAQTGNNEEDWLRAIGHWAVVLSNEDYWQAWYKQKSLHYGGTAQQVNVKQIREQVAQRVEQYWEQIQTADTGGLLAAESARYLALFQWERQAVVALQHVLQGAARQNVSMPEVVEQVGSPLLLKRYHLNTAIRGLLDALQRVKVSPYEAELLRKSLSAEAEIEALLEARQYELALQYLQDRPQLSRYKELLGVTYQHLIEDLLSRSEVERAVERANGFLKEMPAHPRAEELLAKAAAAWGDSLISQKAYTQVIRRLLEIRKSLSRPHRSLETVLADAYARYGTQKLEANAVDDAVKYLVYSLKYDDSNIIARQNLAHIYHSRALEQMQAGALANAIESARQALDYEFDPQTARLLVATTTMLILNEIEAGRLQQVASLIPLVLQYGQQCNDLSFYTESVRAIAATLSEEEHYLFAVRWLEEVYQTGYDEDVFDVEQALSTLLTGLGMVAASQQDYAGARSLWQRALAYNPYNMDAQSGLRRLGGY